MKHEKLIAVVLIILMLGLIIVVINRSNAIMQNQSQKPKPEIIYSADTKYCKIIVDGSCIPMRVDTNISISQVAGYDKIYNVSINYNTADIPQEKPDEKSEPEKQVEVKK